MSGGTALQSVLARCSAPPADSPRLPAAVAALRAIVPCAQVCYGAVDPDTWLPVTHAHDQPSSNHLGAIWANEYLTPDVNKFRGLAHTRSHVGVLSAATGHQVGRSQRYQSIFRGLGIEHELRAVLMRGSAMWGYLVLLRPPDAPDFSAVEAALVAAAAPHLAAVLCSEALDGAIHAAPGRGAPGLLLLGADDRVLAMSDAAAAWLDAFGWRPETGARLPEALYILAAAARGAADQEPRARLRTPDGRWLMVRAASLHGPDATGRVGLTMEEAQITDVVSLLVQAFDFTPRERRVASLVMQGYRTDEIARCLCITPYTVQDHLKSIFDKTGVRSRQGLVGALFQRSASAEHTVVRGER